MRILVLSLLLTAAVAYIVGNSVIPRRLSAAESKGLSGKRLPKEMFRVEKTGSDLWFVTCGSLRTTHFHSCEGIGIIATDGVTMPMEPYMRLFDISCKPRTAMDFECTTELGSTFSR